MERGHGTLDESKDGFLDLDQHLDLSLSLHFEFETWTIGSLILLFN